MTKLWDALDRLENGEKWTSGTVFHEGKRCMLGALGNATESKQEVQIYKALDSDPDAIELAKVIVEQFPEYEKFQTLSGPARVIFNFNDDRHHEHAQHAVNLRHFEDVRMVMEKAAIRCDEFLQ